MGQEEENTKTCGQKCGDGFAGFKHFIYHTEPVEGDVPGETQGICMGRTGVSWAKIGLFYLIFYGFLAGFFAIMLTVFLKTVNSPSDGGPKLTQFIKNAPGLTRLDSGDDKLKLEYDSNDIYIAGNYSKVINKYLNSFNTKDTSGKLCAVGGSPIAKGEKPCIFDVDLLDECNGKNNTGFGVSERKPCIFIKINKIYDWIPKGTDYLELSCTKGVVYPKGFLLSAFPYRRQPGYVSPVVAVKIDTSGTTEKVESECTLKGTDIDVSGSFNPARAYGKIKIEVRSK